MAKVQIKTDVSTSRTATPNQIINTSNNPVGANRSSGGGLPKQPAHPPHTLESVGDPGSQDVRTSRDSR